MELARRRVGTEGGVLVTLDADDACGESSPTTLARKSRSFRKLVREVATLAGPRSKPDARR